MFVVQFRLAAFFFESVQTVPRIGLWGTRLGLRTRGRIARNRLSGAISGVPPFPRAALARCARVASLHSCRRPSAASLPRDWRSRAKACRGWSPRAQWLPARSSSVGLVTAHHTALATAAPCLPSLLPPPPLPQAPPRSQPVPATAIAFLPSPPSRSPPRQLHHPHRNQVRSLRPTRGTAACRSASGRG